MAALKEHLNKLREERIVREKARIEKLRELNFKKYHTNDSDTKLSMSTTTVGKKHFKNISSYGFKPAQSTITLKPDAKPKAPEKATKIPAVKKNAPTNFKNVNGLIKRPFTAPEPKKSVNDTASTQKPMTAQAKSDLNNIKIRKSVVEPKKIAVQSKIPACPVNDNKKIELKINGSNIRAKWGKPSVTAINASTGDANNIPKYMRKSLAPTHPDTIEPKINDSNMKAKCGKPSITAINASTGDVKNIPKYMRKSLAPTHSDSDLVDAKMAKTAPKNVRKSFAPRFDYQKPIITTTNPTPIKSRTLRKTIEPKRMSQSASKIDNGKRQSVFERLYQPKIRTRPVENDVQKLKNNPEYFNKLLKNTRLILNKRHTVFEQPKVSQQPVRRSISAVHFKRMSKSEIANCIHKWSSIGDKLDKVSLQDINEDENVRQDKIVSAVKSERKKVKFQTPVPTNFNTPKPEELQRRLQNWLKKRGKSLDSYHHLQCFGIDHLVQKEIRPFNLERVNFVPETNVASPRTKPDEVEVEADDKFVSFDDEDKENAPLASDSDDDSYTDNMNDRVEDVQIQYSNDKWRKASFVSDSMDLNETQNTTLTMTAEMHHVDELLVGALNDLTEMLREGFDWEQSASWLRAIRERFPNASDTAAYWECRAALEERRGDLPASVQCWEQAIAKGTEHSVVEANLDQLLDKFMQLKISPTSGRARQPDPKMVDVKNVFKSTLIRFAVQQAKLRQSEAPKFTVTPVRRSARLSVTGHWSGKRTPLRVCTTVRQAGLLGHPITFVPNDKLAQTP